MIELKEIVGGEGFSCPRKGGVGYQIFVESFRDGDGDGKGDLKGILEALPYLDALGVGRVWLTPIFKSGSYHRYDTEDYLKVDPPLGTEDDLKELIEAYHSKGIEVILDLVLNHTSFQHPWFLQSQKDVGRGYYGPGSKADYYCYIDGLRHAYTYSPVAKKAYEGRFSGWMPDLNLDSPDVRQEVDGICRKWLTLGVDGFRLDAVRFYYFQEREKTVEFLRFLRRTCDKYRPGAYIVGEAWEDFPDLQSILDYASSGIPMFHFPLALAREAGPGAAVSFHKAWKEYPRRIVEDERKLLEVSGGKSRMALFVSNHDTDRWKEVVAPGAKDQGERMKLAMGLLLLTPGTPWLYYGEELGMEGKRGIEGPLSDAPRRTAMPWKDGVRCKNPEGYVEKTVAISPEDAIKDPSSLLTRTRALVAMRNRHDEYFAKGEFRIPALELPEDVLALESVLPEGRILILHHKGAGESKLIVPPGLRLDAPAGHSELSGEILTMSGYSSAILY